MCPKIETPYNAMSRISFFAWSIRPNANFSDKKAYTLFKWLFFTRNGQCCRSTQECKEYKSERKLDDWWNMYYALTFLTKKPLRYSFYVLFKSQSILWSLILHGCESRCRLGRPEFLDSDLLCMIDSVYDTSFLSPFFNNQFLYSHLC